MLDEKKNKFMVIAGAGISVSAGVPDFRSSSGLFKTLKERHNLKGPGKELFHANVYMDNNSTLAFHDMVRNLAGIAHRAEPTAFHKLLASLASEGRLMRLYTQNIDCIDTRLKPLATKVPLDTPWPVTIQLHGGLDTMVCNKCRNLEPFDGEQFKGHEAPLCAACQTVEDQRMKDNKRNWGVGCMRPRIMLYGEANPDGDAIDEVIRADVRSPPDVLLVVGTSFTIPGVLSLAKQLCTATRRKGGVTAWINVEQSPAAYRHLWDVVVTAECDVVASRAQLPPYETLLQRSSLRERVQEPGRGVKRRRRLPPAQPDAAEEAQALAEPSRERSQTVPSARMRRSTGGRKRRRLPAARVDA